MCIVQKMPIVRSSVNDEMVKARRLEEKKEENKALQEKRKKEIEYLKSKANIPSRYEHSKFTAIAPNQKDLITVMKNNYAGKKLKDISDMLINGEIGTGKTYLAIGLINSLLNLNIECKYITEHALLELYFRKDYIKFDTFKKVKVLVIDELAKRELIDWQMIQIEELLSYRYNEQLPTILITNKNTKDFKSFLGSRLTDRLRGNNIIVHTLVGDSLRGKQL